MTGNLENTWKTLLKWLKWKGFLVDNRDVVPLQDFHRWRKWRNAYEIMSFWPACQVEGCWVSRNPQARATIWPQPAGRATRLWKHELLGPRPLQAPCAMYQCNGVLPCSQSTLLLRVLLHAGAVPPLTQFRRMGSSPSSHLWSRHHSAHKFTITILTINF